MTTRTHTMAKTAPAKGGDLLGRWLFDHPQTVGETYSQHALVAGRFGLAMLAGGTKCLVHAVLPRLHQRAGSDTVRDLHRQLEQRRAASECDPDYVI